ncbi:MAG: efflux RND transporter periplasmic adaptor subunit [Acidobacteria bacterium]|nr:efflux RND transporter periplasmic adaptor subunit [Acidobacteriota bacterium]
MNETGEKEIVEIEPAARRRRIHPAAFVVAGVAALGILVLLGWYLLGSRGESGKPVPAPRSTMDQPQAETTANPTLALTADQLKNASVTIETVGEQLSTESTETSATGTVEPNEYKQAPAVTLIGGIVRRVIPQLGDSVSAGQTVAVVFSNDFAEAQARYIALQTEAANARRNYERSQRLATINAPGRSELEETTKSRKAAEAALSEMRNRYDRTVKLVRIGAASREELEQDNTKLRTAEAEVEQARLRESRATQHLPISNEVRTASEEALNHLQSAESSLSAARQKLLLYGMPPARVNALRSTLQITSELSVPSPASGTVTSRTVNVGEVVDANKELLRVTDLSNVWVIAQVYENDVARMRVGTGASISSDAFPNRLFRGQITYIDPQLDESTRTGKVRIEVANPGRELKLGMYVRVAFGALGNMERTVPVVPADAVQNINGKQVVFLLTNDSNVFELRPVRLAAASEGRYQVLEGLQVGDKVVVTGSFALRAEWLKRQQGTEQHQH